MKALGGLALMSGIVDRFRDWMRRCVTSAILALGGAVLILCAFGFAIVGAFMWLSARLPDHLAALSVAGALAVIGAVVIAVAVAFGRRRSHRGISTVNQELSAELENEAYRAVQATLNEIKANPSAALMTAVTLGFIIGLLGPDKRK